MNNVNEHNYTAIPYRSNDHGSWKEEWALHEGCNDWHYLTGYVHDINNPDHMYFVQYTIAHFIYEDREEHGTHLAITDFKNNKKYYKYTDEFIYMNHDTIKTNQSTLKVDFDQKAFDVICDAGEFSYNLHASSQKEPVWHADNGVLVMGNSFKPDYRTTYFSFTNLDASGTLSIVDESGNTETIQCQGKLWLDKQYGPYKVYDPYAHWEWFSFRFFDQDELMVFSFPNVNILDATYYDKDQNRQVFSDAYYTYDKLIVNGDFAYTSGWNFVLPIKDKKYKVIPIMEDHFHGVGDGYFEGMANVYDENDTHVGYCVIELMPLARVNEPTPVDASDDIELDRNSSLESWLNSQRGMNAINRVFGETPLMEHLFSKDTQVYPMTKRMSLKKLAKRSRGHITDELLSELENLV